MISLLNVSRPKNAQKSMFYKTFVLCVCTFDFYSTTMNFIYFQLFMQPIKSENIAVAAPNDLKKDEIKTSTELTSEPPSKKQKENEPTEIRSPEPVAAVKVESEPMPVPPGKFNYIVD